MKITWSRLAPVGGALLTVACSGSPARTLDVSAPSASASGALAVAPLPQGDEIVFDSTIVGAPAVDGELVEWVERTGQVDHVSVFATEAGIYFAGELDPAYAPGMYLTVGSKVPPLPMIGEPTRGGGHQELDCVHERDYIEGSYIATERLLPPDVAKKCLDHVAAFEKQRAAHAARFTSRFVLDGKGIASVDADGARSPAPGATLAWKPIDRGVTRFEAFVPAAAMPRLSESPVMTLFVLGGTIAKKPPAVDETAPPLAIMPLMFPPHADVRTMLFARFAVPGYVGESFVESAALSFAATDPSRVEAWSHVGSGETIEPTSSPIYESLLKVGDVEVGTSNVFAPFLSILKKGEMVDLVSPPATIRKVIERDGEIHIVAFQEKGWAPITGYHEAEWKVAIVDASGNLREEDLAATYVEARNAAGCSWRMIAVDEGKSTASATYDQLDWTGWCETGDPDDPKGLGEAGFQVSFKWSSAKKAYVGTHKKVPVPKHPKR